MRRVHGGCAGLALSAALVLVAGCTPVIRDGGVGDADAWAARRGTLAPRDQWRLEGRVAIDAGHEGYTGSLTWDQQGGSLEARFDGPFGVGGLRISGDGGGLTVRTHRGETFTVTDPERDLGARLGWSLPIHSMRYWMAGIPAPGAPFSAEVDGLGRPRTLVQHGWTVSYGEYRPSGDLDLPRRLTLERDAVRIKLVAERWTLRP